MLEWQDVIPYVASKLGQDAQHIPAILKFLHVLPEEVTEGRKINLSVCSTDTSPTWTLTGAKPCIRIHV